MGGAPTGVVVYRTRATAASKHNADDLFNSLEKMGYMSSRSDLESGYCHVTTSHMVL